MLRFDDRPLKYDFGELDEVSLAYAIGIHKSQGSEFPAVVIPLAMQHFTLLQRNLIYTELRGARDCWRSWGRRRHWASRFVMTRPSGGTLGSSRV